ncbi:MAG TPA: chromate transporter [Clostridia bacterium]
MEIYIKLFLMFAKLSVFAFGGGYVMFPMLQAEVEKNGVIAISELNDIIALAGMTPGAVAVNAAVGVGYKAAGIGGVVSAITGVMLPCALIVVAVAACFFRIYKNPVVQAALYGLRPVITGIILYAAIKLAGSEGILLSVGGDTINNGLYMSISSTLVELKSAALAAISFILLVKTKIHPIYLILASGLAGILLF